ncbi:MAG: mercuric reductase [Acidobacteria bacterium]|nr:mercuric reductase [Acidobacteriota bacterium]
MSDTARRAWHSCRIGRELGAQFLRTPHRARRTPGTEREHEPPASPKPWRRREKVEDRRVNDDDRLLAQVRPESWRNPEPASLYDLVVIGGGTAGLVCAAGAAGLGARVALVERRRLGGDCLNTGCVPSKALLRAARAVHEARAGAASGVTMTPQVDFAAVMRSVRARRADLAHHDSATRLTSLGVHVFFGDASFTGRRTIAVAGCALRYRRAVVATGGRPTVPPVPGLSEVPYFTSENIFELTEQPRTLLVVGGGPIGCEMAQAFALLGTMVTLIEAGPRLLPREDADASEIVTRHLEQDGVRVVTDAIIARVTSSGDRITMRLTPGLKARRYNSANSADRVNSARSPASADTDVVGDALLVATGRSPNVEGLNLDRAGVRHGEGGVHVDDRLRSSNRQIYAAGDVCSKFQFTHAADAMARIVIQNALFHGRRRASALVIPWSTYTCPEVAHVGLTSVEAAQAGGKAVTVPLADVDRAVIDRESDGFLRVHHQGGRIIAATLVAPHAGELIGYIASAMRRGGSLGDFSNEIFPYPTLADALRKAGDSYRRTRLTPRARSILRRYFTLIRWIGPSLL